MKLLLMMVQTVDGITVNDAHPRVDWSSKDDKQTFMEETKKHGVVIMGRTTYNTLKRPLPHRLNLVLTSTPEKYKKEEKEGLVKFFNGTPQQVVEYLKSKGFQSAVLAGGPKTNAEFLKAGVVDEILVTFEPLIFGTGQNITHGGNFNIQLELLEENRLNKNTILLRYKIVK